MTEPQPHILVVDDHREIRDLIGRYLLKNGFRITTAESAAAARKALKAAAVDLVVLDIMMPGEDGLSLCRFLRESSDTPVILLTAMAEDTDRVVGLEIGANCSPASAPCSGGRRRCRRAATGSMPSG